MALDRRNFLRVTGGTGLGFGVSMMLGGCETLLEQIRNRPIRRSIATLSNTHPIIEAYRDAIAQMKALPSGDRRNWTRQAEIHNNSCPHGNWYFLPWHRAYLYYFEVIVRELSGYEDFALPYWNWTCQPQIPAHFFGGSSNPMFDATRTKTASDTIPTTITGETLVSDILDIADFENFGSFESTALRGGSGGGYGELEGTPHNLVHGWIGGNMGGFMSPLDPVFWCHHNMVERLWWEWNITRGNPNPDASSWSNLSLGNMFSDETGALVTDLTVGTTALMPLLSYQFDDQVIPCGRTLSGFTALPADMSKVELENFLKKGGAYRLKTLHRIPAQTFERLQIQGRQERRIMLTRDARQLIMAEMEQKKRFILKVSNAKLVGTPDAFVRVFVNSPSGLARRADIDNPHYAGSFAFFGDGQHGDQHSGNTYHIDITSTIEALRRGGQLRSAQDVEVTMVAVSMADGRSVPRGRVEIGNLEVMVSETTPRN